MTDTTLNELAGDDRELTKAAAIAGYAETLINVANTSSAEGRQVLVDAALDAVRLAKDADSDPDLIEVRELLELYR